MLLSQGAGPMPLKTEIRAPHRAVHRYLPARSFPPYRFVPGLQPHPVRDPRGHSHFAPPRAASSGGWNPAAWQSTEEWLYGVDLFNAFYFWEAHESWETGWATLPRHSAPALLLQGLIQIAAALLKIHLGSRDGARKLSSRGLDKLSKAAEDAPRLLGLDVHQTGAEFERYFRPLSERALPPLDASVPILSLSGEWDA
ncbi:MAG TPA: DUF309 domain-containing protein [Candidatus Binatia bacterium]|nr:DUF309 domain-containing protein [Candidatus Binatia bacterium]